MSYGDKVPAYVQKAYDAGFDFIQCGDGVVWDLRHVAGGDPDFPIRDPRYKWCRKEDFDQRDIVAELNAAGRQIQEEMAGVEIRRPS